MSTNLKYLANQIAGLTYTDMMEVAEWFATYVQNVSGDDESAFDAEDKNEWAELLSTWAESYLEETSPEVRPHG